jgi:hypothetical protein
MTLIYIGNSAIRSAHATLNASARKKQTPNPPRNTQFTDEHSRAGENNLGLVNMSAGLPLDIKDLGWAAEKPANKGQVNKNLSTGPLLFSQR